MSNFAYTQKGHDHSIFWFSEEKYKKRKNDFPVIL